MVTSINRNWFSGLASGMDTQGLIDKIIQMERLPLDSLSKKKTTLQFQREMLQGVNLKLFETQNKATDLIFARTFSTKKVTSSNEKLVTATASSDSKVGSYTVRVKQLATSTQFFSQEQLAGPLQYGRNAQTTATVGGKNLTLGGPGVALGVTDGDIQIAVAGGGTHTLNVGAALSSASTLDAAIATINAEISLVGELNGKIKATYDERTNQMKFQLLDTSKTMTVSDSGGDLLNVLFGTGSFQLTSNAVAKASTSGQIRAGEAATLFDLNVTLGTIQVTRGAGPAVNLDLSTLTPASTVAETITHLNHKLDQAFGWSGNPDDRVVAFRFDASTRKIILANTDPEDTTALSVNDGTSNFVTKVFGNPAMVAILDSGDTLANETFGSTITPGKFTIDGTQIQITLNDTLQDVLNRITSSTSVEASYDSSTDRISLRRTDGLNQSIGLGSVSDTSNFLTAVGLTGGNQETAAAKQSQLALGPINANNQLQAEFAGVTAGSLKFTVDGQEQIFTYGVTETLNDVLDRMAEEIDGVEEAYYDSASQQVTIRLASTGTDSTLKIEQLAGNLSQKLQLDTTGTATGLAVGDTLTTSRGVSSIKALKPLNDAGFQTPVAAGSFSINGVTFTIASPASQTLDSILNTISDNVRAGVTARFDEASGKIVLSAKAGGNTSITLGSPTDSSNFLAVTGLASGTVQVGQNSIISIDGVQGGADIIRQSNTIGDVVSGVTFSLRGVTDSNGEAIDIAADKEVARKAIDDFITSYNEVTQLIYTQLTDQHNYEYEALTEAEKNELSAEEVEKYEMVFKIGLLNGDSTLQQVRSRMRVIMSGIVNGMGGSIKSLADIGITTGAVGSSYQDTQVGLLKITDEDKLTSALEDNPDLVAEMFAAEGSSEGTTGIARRLKNALNEFTKSGGMLTSRVGRSGISTGNSEFDKQINLLSEQIARGEERLENRQEALIKQFANLETAMSRYQSQSSAFSQQLAQLG